MNNFTDGGIRGASELLILDDIKKVKHKLKLPETPKPCEYFYLIGGTSTRG